MAQLFEVHLRTHKLRLGQAADLLAKGGLRRCLQYPATPWWRLDDKDAAEGLRRLRGLDERHT